MSYWWPCYRRSGTVGVVIVEGPSLIHARMRAARLTAPTRKRGDWERRLFPPQAANEA
jgi:hypothetical protein